MTGPEPYSATPRWKEIFSILLRILVYCVILVQGLPAGGVWSGSAAGPAQLSTRGVRQQRQANER